MKKLITILLCAAMLLPCMSMYANAEPIEKKFEDVPENAWYYNSVVFADKIGIMNGTSENTFSPNKPITREEFVFIYVKAYRELLQKDKIPHYEKMSFSDVEPNQWYSDYVEYAYQNGIVSGVGNSQFGVGYSIKREDAAIILAPKYSSDEETSVEYWGCEISDMDKVSPYAKNAVTLVCSYTHITYHYLDPHDELIDPIFVGNSSREFMPQKNLTRAEFAAVLRTQLEQYESRFSQ
ncbi:MAG: S-layer homology domain-containing protein [Clostridia bacterium]|nr:S-layer homology domain-containing protein [Clostridia bacterium]